MRNYLALVLLAALACYVTAAPPRRPFRDPAFGRDPNSRDPMSPTQHQRPHHRPHHRRPKPVICKFNSTRLDIDYDVPCDLPEYFECVEGKPSRPRPSFGHRPGGRHEDLDFDGGVLLGDRAVFDRDFNVEQSRRQLEVGSCRQKNCTSDSECGEFFCVNGKCNVTRDVRKYAAACNVTDESGAVVKERQCLGECGTRGSDIVYEGKNLIAYFCRAPHHRDGSDSSEEEDGFDFRPFGVDSEEDSEEWSSEDGDENDSRPFGGFGGRPFGSDEDGGMGNEEFPGFPGNDESFFGGRPERPNTDGRPNRPSSGDNQERPTSAGDRPQRPPSGGRRPGRRDGGRRQ